MDYEQLYKKLCDDLYDLRDTMEEKIENVIANNIVRRARMEVEEANRLRAEQQKEDA